MSELILKGTDLFMKKTGSADKLHICGNAERMLFLIIGILLVFAGAKVYRLIVSFIMFWGVTIALCTVMNGKTGWGTIVTAFTILGCLMGYMAFKWKTADAMILSAMTAAAVVWMCYISPNGKFIVVRKTWVDRKGNNHSMSELRNSQTNRVMATFEENVKL